MTSTQPGTCHNCGVALRPKGTYCRECGGTYLDAAFLQAPAPPASSPPATHVPTRPAAMPAAPVKRPRWVLGTFWLVAGLFCLVAGVVGPKWALLVAAACVVYAVYLYRGGRYGWFFF